MLMLRFRIGFCLIRLANWVAPNIIGGLLWSGEQLPMSRDVLIAAYRKLNP